MKKKLSLISVLLILCFILSACGSSSNTANTSTAASSSKASSVATSTESKSSSASSLSLKDGTYTADFDTDSSMFRINEALDGKCTLTVKDGKATAHISLVSKNIVNLYVGLAENASKDGAVILQPTTDKVKYKDGTSDDVYGFDVPIEVIDEEFDLAIIGTKGKWYDHKVKVTNVVSQ